MQPGRRAFFMPSLRAQSPWQRFCGRLARQCAGPVTDLGSTPDNGGRARLRVAHDEDVIHARALCAEAGVVLVSGGWSDGPPAPGRDALWLEMDDRQAVEAFDAATGVMVAQPGCTVGAARRLLAGSAWTWPDPAADDTDSIERWIGLARGWLPGRCADAGLAGADVMLASGAWEHLGPFGGASTRPLVSADGRRLVSALFELAAQPYAAALRDDAAWPGRYRLDALAPADGAAPNLAHLLLGAGGTLAWPSRFWLAMRPAGDAQPARAAGPARSSLRELPADRVDAEVKQWFDGTGIFPSLVV